MGCSLSGCTLVWRQWHLVQLKVVYETSVPRLFCKNNHRYSDKNKLRTFEPHGGENFRNTELQWKNLFFIETRVFRWSSILLKFSPPRGSNVLNLFLSLSRWLFLRKRRGSVFLIRYLDVILFVFQLKFCYDELFSDSLF